MPSVLDSLQALGRGRGRGDAGPLLLLRQLDGTPGERISHLPVDHELGQAWVAMTREPFRPHQAQALTALRRGEPAALLAPGPVALATGTLMLYAALIGEPGARALVIARDGATAQTWEQELQRVAGALPERLALRAALVEGGTRPDFAARILIATPDALHRRLLRYHDRAWRFVWERLRLTLLPDLHRYVGIAGAHLSDLLLRHQRVAVAHSGRVPALLGTCVELAEPQPALTGLTGAPWRIISGADTQADPTVLAVWRGPADRLRESAELALAFQREGHDVHILCRPLEAAALAPMLGEAERVTTGPSPAPGQVLITAGYPGSRGVLRSLLRSGYAAVVVVLSELPQDQMLARHAESLLTEPPEFWPPQPSNAYVTAQHVLCAATELPLTHDEAAGWGVQQIVERLVARGDLVDLPDPEVAWKPTLQVSDPYEQFSLLSASGEAALVRTKKGRPIDRLDPTGVERWAFPGAALPPGAGGVRVLSQDDEHGSVIVRLETNGRRTWPLRRATVTVRDQWEQRALFDARRIAWGRVTVDEEIYAWRELTPGGTPEEVRLAPSRTSTWVAPACWVELAAEVQTLGQFIGWSLAAALSLRALASFTDVVPCYDPEQRRLYLVDAQPGGCGMAAWLYRNAEPLLQLAYDIAYACRADPLLEPMARADMDWLLPLLGRRAAEPRPAPPEPARPAPPERVRPSPAGRPLPARREPQPARSGPPAAPARPAQEPLPLAGSPASRAAAPPPEEDGGADAAALIERLRRQREARALHRPPAPARTPDTRPQTLQPRFQPGERIFCLPYGEGTVTGSWFDGEREMLSVDFPDHGELPVDPALSLVRRLRDEARGGGE